MPKKKSKKLKFSSTPLSFSKEQALAGETSIVRNSQDLRHKKAMPILTGNHASDDFMREIEKLPIQERKNLKF